jgi:hypothetical protein
MDPEVGPKSVVVLTACPCSCRCTERSREDHGDGVQPGRGLRMNREGWPVSPDRLQPHGQALLRTKTAELIDGERSAEVINTPTSRRVLAILQRVVV